MSSVRRGTYANSVKGVAVVMKKNSPLSIMFILIVTGLAVWYLYPSFMFYSQTWEARQAQREEDPDVLKKVVNLGLDLQGGMRLVLEVDRSHIGEEDAADVLDRAYTIIENRINGLGVAEPSIQKQGKDRLIIELPGLKNEKAAKEVLGSTAQLEFKLLREPAELEKAIRIIDRILKGGRAREAAAVDSGDTALVHEKEAQDEAERLFAGQDAAGDSAASVEEVSEETPGLSATAFTEYLVAVGGNQIGVLEADKAKVSALLARRDIRDALKKAGLGGSHFLWGHELESRGGKELRPIYYVKRRAELKGDIIKDAKSDISRGGLDAGQYVVDLELNREGRGKFSRVTGANVHKYLAIVLDSTVFSAPQIRQKIPHGRAQITGAFNVDDAKSLAIVLRAGALPAPVKIIEERTVGPSLGQDSIRKAAKALILGFILVVGFMLVYYRLAGLIADIALLSNLVFVLAIMAGFNATLTLPGFAGLILIMGMAIDANVIIFERIREELAIGKTVRSAIDAGYSRAFVTIMDANITTLFTAFILMWVGTGPIKGFAVTMIIGIVVSLFTALFLTRVVFNMMTASRNVTKLSI